MRPRSSTKFVLVIVSLLALTITLSVSGGDWPQFRGTAQDGQSLGNGLLDEPFNLELVWKRSLGSGYSSISLVGERGVTLFTDGQNDYMTAFDRATGKELWRYQIAEMYAGHDASHDGPIGTPTVDDGTVYALGPRGRLVAVRLDDGSEVWSKDLAAEEGARAPHFGYSSDPLVVGEVLIVQAGAANGGSIQAFDRRTGKRRWTTGEDTVSYQIPILMELAGRRQVVAVSDLHATGLVPESGEVLWTFQHTSKNPRGGSGTPVRVADNRLLIKTGSSEVVMLEIHGGSGDASAGWTVLEVWRSSQAFKRSHAVPVVYEGYIYGFDNNFLTCLDPRTGEQVWKSRPPGGRGLILVDGQLIVLDAKGSLVLVEATPKGYREVSRLEVFGHEQESWTAASFADGHFYLRNLSEMAVVRIDDTQVTEGGDKE